MDPASPTLAELLDWLALEFVDNKVQYRTLNVYRSALSSTVETLPGGLPMGQHPLVCRLLKACFRLRPPKQRLFPDWNIQVVLSHLEDWPPAVDLSLKQLSMKTVFLLALVSFKRPSDLYRLHIMDGYWQLSMSRFRAQPMEVGKTDRPGHASPPIRIEAYKNLALDPVFYLNAYVRRVKKVLFYALPLLPFYITSSIVQGRLNTSFPEY